jgi:hypothetical protein
MVVRAQLWGAFDAASVLSLSASAGAAKEDKSGVEGINTAARAFLENRNRQLLSGPASAKAGAPRMAGDIARRSIGEEASLRGLRDKLSNAGERYTAFRTQTAVLGTQIVKDRLIARVEERTEFDYAKIHGDEPPFTAHSVERNFTFTQVGGEWVLESVALVHPDGVLPVNEPEAAPAPPTSPGRPAGNEASTARPRGKLRVDTKSAGVSADGSVLALAAGYNYTAMADYARRWALSYNPAYRWFAEDCTNFVSQALYAGGWQMTSGAYNDNRNWWYNFLNQSYPWAGAQNWGDFAWWYSRRTTMLSNVYDMGLADVLQIDQERNGSKDHTMMVTRVAGSERYLSYHSQNTLDKSLTSIIAKYPNAWWYAHRT